MKYYYFFAIISIFVFYSCKKQVTEPVNKQLKVLFPNGGETLMVDSTYNIQWKSQNIDKINLTYSINNGNTWDTLGRNINASDGHFSWKIPDSVTKGGCIMISSIDNSVQDKSDNNFNIDIDNFLKLLFPNGGDTLYVDSTYNIKWQSKDFENINIFYSTNSGTSWETLANDVKASAEHYSWTVPENLTTNGLVKISTPDNSVQDISDNNFTIKYSPHYIQDVSRYYPLKVGDYWVYNFTWIPLYDPSVSYLIKKEIVDKSIFNGKIYYRVKITPIINDSTKIDSNTFIYRSDNWQRFDTTNGWLKVYSQHGDISWFNIALTAGQSITGGSGTGYYKIEVLSEEENQVLGMSTTIKKYKKVDAFQSYLYDFAKNIGLIKYRENGDGNISYVYTLKGAKIDNIVVGDTTTTD